MKVLVLGGTRFIGLELVEQLLGAGDRVAVVHRGEHEPEELRGAEHIHTDRLELGRHRRELARFKPDAVIDLSAMTAADAAAATDALDPSVPVVVASSIDVYRASEGVYANEVTDPVPLREDAALRSGPAPDREIVPPGWAYDAASYEKLDVERTYLDHGATICRLPMVYGERDYKRREEFVLRRVRAGRRRIPVGAGTLLWSRGYAPEIARGLRLAAKRGAGAEVFNLAEPASAPVLDWIEQIIVAAGHEAELVGAAEDLLPDDLLITGEIVQPWLVDSTKAAERLGWVHRPWRECVARSVRWHLDHPPRSRPGDGDLSADDLALAAADRGAATAPGDRH